MERYISSPNVLSTASTEDGIEALYAPVSFSPPSFRPLRKAKTLLSLFVAAAFVVSALYLCRPHKSKDVKGGLGVRRLANGEGSDDGKKNPSPLTQICGELDGSRQSAEPQATAPETTPAQMTPAPPEPVADADKPRKRKRKTNWLETSEASQSPQAKKARDDAEPGEPGTGPKSLTPKVLRKAFASLPFAS